MTPGPVPQPPPSPDVAVIIPTYKRADRIGPLLQALGQQSLDPEQFEVIVVSDCSPDDTVAVVDELAHSLPFRLRAISTSRNAGPATARNLGWRSTGAPFLAFLDDDCIPDPEWLAGGVTALRDQAGAGVIQGRTIAPHPLNLRRLNDWYVWRVVEKSEPEFMACNIFYRRQAFEATGGFDEDIGWWGEDTAAAWKVLQAGWGRGFASNATAVHSVERRGWAWFVRNGLNERNLIDLGVAFPDYRAEKFWRPWAYRKEDVALVAALVGLAVGLRLRPALLLALPYLWWRRPSARYFSFFRLCLQVPVVDAARVIGHLRGSLDQGVFVI